MYFDVHIVGRGIIEGVDAELASVLRCDERSGADKSFELAAAVVVLWYGFGKVLHPEEGITVGADGVAASGVKHCALRRR